MAVSYSNTTLRVPGGFANLLEGLAREILRDQPEDIPAYAAQYFTALLKKREEGGMDLAKRGELMEHRISNNDASKDAQKQENWSPDQVTRSSINVDRLVPSEDKLIEANQNSSLSPVSLEAFKDNVSPELRPSDEQIKSEDESGETDFAPDPEFSYRGTADVDICAEELNKTVEEHTAENVDASVDEENEIEEKDLEPVSLSSYGGLTNVDVCSEELRTTMQEDDPTKGSDIPGTEAHFIPTSESPDPVHVEHDVLDSQDEFASDTETSLYVEQDASEELNGTEEKVGFPVKEGESGEPEQDDDETASTLFDDDAGREIPNAEQLDLNEGSESISVSEGVKTFDVSNPDEILPGVEKQKANDILAADTDLSESSFLLENYSLADRSNEDNPGMEDLAKLHEENNDGDSDTDATDDGDFQNDMREDKTNDAPQDISETIPVADTWGLEDLDTIGFSSDDVNTGDSSQHVVSKVEDTSDTDQGMSDVNAPETQVTDGLFFSTFTHESEPLLPPSTSEETEQDATYKQSSTASQEHIEEPETATDYEEDMVHENILESENKDVEQQEESSQPQEEEDIMDIPLDDPEANKAAAKIQAGFRGHMTRKKLKPGDKPGEEVSSTGETLNGSQGDAAGGSEGVETDETSVPEQ